MSCINGPTAPGRPEGPGRVAVAVLCLRRGSHARAHRQQGSHDRAHLAAGSHDVIPTIRPMTQTARTIRTAGTDGLQSIGPMDDWAQPVSQLGPASWSVGPTLGRLGPPPWRATTTSYPSPRGVASLPILDSIDLGYISI